MAEYVKFHEDYFGYKKNDLVQVSAGYAEMVVAQGVATVHPAPQDKPEKPKPEKAEEKEAEG